MMEVLLKGHAALSIACEAGAVDLNSYQHSVVNIVYKLICERKQYGREKL